jgi:hypothetical protein
MMLWQTSPLASNGARKPREVRELHGSATELRNIDHRGEGVIEYSIFHIISAAE